MKKIILALSALVAMSSLGFADENNDYEEEADGLYLGLAYTHLSLDLDRKQETTVSELDYTAGSLQVGYKFNPYIAVEGRYGMTFGNPDASDAPIIGDSDITVWSIYVKPIYPVAPEFDIYALLGYASANVTGNILYNGTVTSFDVDESGFSWGVGGVYAITEEFSVFADYLLFHDESSTYFDEVLDSFSLGVTYKF